jgi:hypothetical protein
MMIRRDDRELPIFAGASSQARRSGTTWPRSAPSQNRAHRSAKIAPAIGREGGAAIRLADAGAFPKQLGCHVVARTINGGSAAILSL